MKIMVDINVTVDMFQNREPLYEFSSAVISEVVAARVEGILAGHTIPTIYYLMEKYQDHSKAMESVDWLLRYFEIAEINKETLLKAKNLAMIDYEDAIIAASAQNACCDYIITHNIADFKNAPVSVLTPLEFMLQRK